MMVLMIPILILRLIMMAPSRRDIPAANYRMHSMHCARNIALCPVCNEPVPRGELEEHKQENHAKKQCPDCGASIEASKLEEHKTSLCEKRIECCPYCALNQEMSEMETHKAYCGSRTEKCEECKEIIMLKNWEMHIDSNHGFIKLKDGKSFIPSTFPIWVLQFLITCGLTRCLTGIYFFIIDFSDVVN